MLARLKRQAQLCWLSAAQKAGPGAAQQFLEGARLASLSPLTEMHDGIRAQIHQLLASCLQNHCIQDHAQKDRGASIGASRVQALVPRPAGRARNVWPIRNGSTEFQGVLLEDYSSSSQRGDPEVEAARYPAPGETGCFFRGRAFPGNIYQSPFPSRFKRREYNLRMVQLQTSASAVMLVHELVQVLVCKQSEQSTLAARDLAR